MSLDDYPSWDGLPQPRRLTQRRFLVMGVGTEDQLLVWIDDEGTCARQHIRGDKGEDWPLRMHKYRDSNGKLYAIRCPRSLSDDEWTRAHADEPAGSWKRIIHGLREAENAKKQKGRKRAEVFTAIVGAVATTAARYF